MGASSGVSPRFHEVARTEVGATVSWSGFHSKAASPPDGSVAPVGGVGSKTLLKRVLRGFMFGHEDDGDGSADALYQRDKSMSTVEGSYSLKLRRIVEIGPCRAMC
jgi:hypothetical protein